MMPEEYKPTTPKPFVFVLMPFAKEFDDIYKFGIKGAAEDAGAYAERVDEQMFDEGILERVFNQINKADVVVSDMTGRNPNVFYEVGYAHALGKVVLLLTQDADDIPFDLQHRPHIIYEKSIEKLRKALGERLEWAIGESRRRSLPRVARSFVLSIEGVRVPEDELGEDAPVVDIDPSEKLYRLRVNVLNSSEQESSAITYIYLSATTDSPLLPYTLVRGGLKELTGGPGPVIKSTKRPAQMRPIDPCLGDTGDPLSQRFRLAAMVPFMPPGAVETFQIPLMAVVYLENGQYPFRLSLCLPRGVHDFPFRLKVVR